MKLTLTTFFFFAAAALLPGSAPVVGSCNGVTGYPTIAAAIAASPAGSTISICPGDYPEQLLITKSLNLVGLTSTSISNAAVVIKVPVAGMAVNAHSLSDGASEAAQILIQNGAYVTISNLTVDGSNSQIAGCGPDLVGIFFQRGSGSVTNSVVRNQALTSNLNGCQSGQGIFIESGYGTSGSANVSVQASSIHGYQKNGITADGSNTTFDIDNNFISGQGPTNGAAENGIQISDGARGSANGNTVIDNIYSGANFGASGILVYAAQGITISNNTIGSSQLPIVTYTDSTAPSPSNPKGTADNTTITGNRITNTQVSDGIDACSNNNYISGNTIFNALTSGIHLDSTCGNTGRGNTVTLNTVNESCTGILQGGGGNIIFGNTSFNVRSSILAGDVCAAGPPALGTANSAPVQTAQLQPSRR